jgi:hypothetical protein
VQNKIIKYGILITAINLMLASSANAFDMGNMMNPSKWMGGNKDKDRYDDYGPGPGYGYGGGPGYGYGPGPGYGYGGGPGYGYGPGPGYGYGGGPGYGYGGNPAYSAPGAGSNDAEIMRLRERLRQLEGGPR